MSRKLDVISLNTMSADYIDQLLTAINRTLVRLEPGAEFIEREGLLEMRVIEGVRLILPSLPSADVQQPVDIKTFALSKTPLKPEQWYGLFVFHSDSQQRIATPEYGEILRMRHSDARDFIERVADRTDHPYRLPSAHELEFALGVGSSRNMMWEAQAGEFERYEPDTNWNELKPVFVARSLPELVQNAEGEFSINEFIRGEVNPNQENISLACHHAACDEVVTLARLAKPVAGKITVQFLLNPTEDFDAELDFLVSEMQRILIERGRTHPWRYAVANCPNHPSQAEVQVSKPWLNMRKVHWIYNG